jgi:hypothetical protein
MRLGPTGCSSASRPRPQLVARGQPAPNCSHAALRALRQATLCAPWLPQDVCCGEGATAIQFAAVEGWEVTGVEIVPTAVKVGVSRPGAKRAHAAHGRHTGHRAAQHAKQRTLPAAPPPQRLGHRADWLHRLLSRHAQRLPRTSHAKRRHPAARTARAGGTRSCGGARLGGAAAAAAGRRGRRAAGRDVPARGGPRALRGVLRALHAAAGQQLRRGVRPGPRRLCERRAAGGVQVRRGPWAATRSGPCTGLTGAVASHVSPGAARVPICSSASLRFPQVSHMPLRRASHGSPIHKLVWLGLFRGTLVGPVLGRVLLRLGLARGLGGPGLGLLNSVNSVWRTVCATHTATPCTLRLHPRRREIHRVLRPGGLLIFWCGLPQPPGWAAPAGPTLVDRTRRRHSARELQPAVPCG